MGGLARPKQHDGSALGCLQQDTQVAQVTMTRQLCLGQKSAGQCGIQWFAAMKKTEISGQTQILSTISVFCRSYLSLHGKRNLLSISAKKSSRTFLLVRFISWRRTTVGEEAILRHALQLLPTLTRCHTTVSTTKRPGVNLNTTQSRCPFHRYFFSCRFRAVSLQC